MTSFCISVALLGAFAGLFLPLATMVCAVAVSIAIGIACDAWKGAPLIDMLWPSILCIVIIQLGYFAGLLLGAYAVHRGRLIASATTWKFWRQRRP